MPLKTFRRLYYVLGNVNPVSKATLYNQIKEGSFPRPINIGPRAVAWLEDDLIAWQEQKLAEHRSEAA